MRRSIQRGKYKDAVEGKLDYEQLRRMSWPRDPSKDPRGPYLRHGTYDRVMNITIGIGW